MVAIIVQCWVLCHGSNTLVIDRIYYVLVQNMAIRP
jgi:hypothetical protein